MEKQEGRRAAETVPPSGGSGLRSSMFPKGHFPEKQVSSSKCVCQERGVGVGVAHMIVGAGKSEIRRAAGWKRRCDLL